MFKTYQYGLVALASMLVLSGCGSFNGSSAPEDMSSPPSTANQGAATTSNAVQQPPKRQLTRAEVLALADQQAADRQRQTQFAESDNGFAPAATANEVRDQTSADSAAQSQPAPSQSATNQAATNQPTSSQVAASQPPSRPQLGTANCPADPLIGKWISTEVRTLGSGEQLPVALGYMFREDGYFATAMFDASGAKQAEFEGEFRAKQNASGECVVTFDVPGRDDVSDIAYDRNGANLQFLDQRSQTAATFRQL